MRLFVALTPSAAQRRLIAEEIQRPLAALLPGVRWVGGETMHITLRFLGEVAEERIPDVTAAVERAAAGVPPFDLALGGPGVFPAERNARVLWLAVAEGGGESARLAAAVERELAVAGFAPVDRPFAPHLTIGRLRAPVKPRKLAMALAEHGHCRTPATRIERLTLYQSHLRPQGAEHVPIFVFPLAARG